MSDSQEATPIYAGLSREEIIRQYNPREAVPEYESWLTLWTRESEWARTRMHGELDIAYGPRAGERLDVFTSESAGAPASTGPVPTCVFVHGGFWRFLDKSDHSLASRAVVDAGAVSVQLNYDLCPTVTLPVVVDEVRRGLKWVYNNVAKWNGDPDNITVVGHSAGAHLAAMLAVDGWAEQYGLPSNAVKRAVVVSALFELAPMLQIPGGEDLGLDKESARAMSPLHLPAAPHIDYLVAVGERETDQWCRQTDAMVEKLMADGLSAERYISPWDHHYSILPTLSNETTGLGQRIVSGLFGR